MGRIVPGRRLHLGAHVALVLDASRVEGRPAQLEPAQLGQLLEVVPVLVLLRAAQGVPVLPAALPAKDRGPVAVRADNVTDAGRGALLAPARDLRLEPVRGAPDAPLHLAELVHDIAGLRRRVDDAPARPLGLETVVGALQAVGEDALLVHDVAGLRRRVDDAPARPLGLET